jgi:hypothetical protein
MAGKVTRTYQDYTGEKSSLQVYIVDLTAGNIAATLTAMDVFTAAVDAVTLGNPIKNTVIAQEEVTGSGNAGSAFAQRESKWLCTYRDDVTNDIYTAEIPCADLQFLVPGSDLMNIASGDGATFKAQWDTFVK